MVWIAAYQWLLAVGIVAGISVEFPDPQKEFRLCGRKNASFICDPDFILEIADGDRLNKLAANFRKSTKCLCSECERGISLGVFIKTRLTQETMEKYPSGKSVAEMLRKRWHLGKCNDDIIIILLKETNISDYSLGPAVKKILPLETAELIMKDCRNHFLSGWYYQGLESVLTSFNDVLIKQQKEKKTTFNTSLITGLCLGIGVLFILLILAILLLRRQHKRRKLGCSDIYESVSTQTNHKKFLKDMKKQNFEMLNKSQDSDDDDDEEEESEDDANTLSQQFLQIKRNLSAVAEESDDNETVKDNTSFIKEAYTVQSKNRPLQVTEL